jgi:2-C-methyl-D-erythritol 4-phosphate cytidylyltransferase
VGAIVAAAGSSSRAGGADKLFATLAGRPLLSHVLSAIEAAPEVDRIVVVAAAPNLDRVRDLVADSGFAKVTAVCEGGERRQDSVRLGLEALGQCDWVLVQDGCRLLLHDTIAAGLEAAGETGAAIPAVPVSDTLKHAGEGDTIERTVDRAGLWAAQTPQVFRYDVLARAHREVSEDVTDDAAMLEALGIPVRLFPGSPLNLKVTTAGDLALAEALLSRAESRLASNP